MSGGSYESSNDQRLHFGLGQASKVDAVEIRWPSGSVEQVSLPNVDRFFAVEEGKGLVSSVYDTIAGNTAGAHSTHHAGPMGLDDCRHVAT